MMTLNAPLRIALTYLLFGFVWIICSDLILVWTDLSSISGYYVSASKGAVFVALSSLLVYGTARSHVNSQLRASELARAVIDETSDAMFVKDRNGRYLMFNAAASKLVGKEIKQVLGRDDRSLFDALSAELVTANDRRVMETGLVETSEEQLTAGGATRTYLATKAPYRDSQGKVVGVIGVSRDISERKEAELLLRNERDRFEKIMATVPVAICSFARSPTGQLSFPYASPHIEKIYGVNRQQLAEDGSVIFAHIHPDDLPGIIESIESSAKNLSQWHAEFRVKSPVLGEIWVEGRSIPTSQPDGSVVWNGYVADVTDRIEFQEKMSQIKSRLKDAQFIAKMGSWTWQPGSSSVWWSDAIYELFGVDPATTSPSFEAFVELLEPSDRELAYQRVQAISNGAAGFANELRIRRPDGRTIWIYSVGRATRNPQGQLLRVDGFDQDITSRKRLEEQLRQSQKMEAVGRLAGGIAHDFNNLLTVINGYCEILMSQLENVPDERSSVAAIQEAAERATKLTRQLLAFGRRALVEPRVLDLNEVVKQSEALLRRLVGEDIELETSFRSACSYIEVDPIQIDQVMLNLAVNARDAMPRGGRLSISTCVEEINCEEQLAHHEPDGRLVVLTVSDTGEGMSEEVRERIFEPFFTTKQQGHGTGLGLAVVHGIVDQAGGDIQVESTVGHGTTFRLYFREARAEAAPELPSTLSTHAGGSETILLVEDEPALRRLCQQVLQEQGYRIFAAGGAQEALNILDCTDENFHMVVTDLVMPEMGGIELADELRKRVAGLRVLFISGYSEEKVAVQGMRNGIDAFLQKPFLPTELTLKVRQILDETAERP
jgi:PAS domain S-box-containing protein